MITYPSDKVAVRHAQYRTLVHTICILEAVHDQLTPEQMQDLEKYRAAARSYELHHLNHPDEYPTSPIEGIVGPDGFSIIPRGPAMPAAFTIGIQGARALRQAGHEIKPEANLTELVHEREHLTHAVLTEPAIGEKGLWAVSFYDSLAAANVDYKRSRAARQVVLQETTGKVLERRKLE